MYVPWHMWLSVLSEGSLVRLILSQRVTDCCIGRRERTRTKTVAINTWSSQSVVSGWPQWRRPATLDRTQKSALVHDSGGNAERSQQACTALAKTYCQCKFSWTNCNRPCSRWLYLEIPIWDSNPPRVRPLYCNQEQHRRLQAWVAAAKRGHMLSAASP